MPRLPERRRYVSDEAHLIAPELLNHPLGSFRRRTTAFVVDVVLFGLIVGVLVLGVSGLSIHREDPTIFPQLFGTAPAAADSSATLTAIVHLLQVMNRRVPDLAPEGMAAMIEAGDVEGISNTYGMDDLTLTTGSGKSELLRSDDRWVLKVGTDLLLGRFGSFFSWGAFFVAWFTLWTRLSRGRTPGKRLCGLQVVRLDGRPLTWWDCFGRSGGYGASAATLFVGFLEAIWHPNRQAIHDRIAGTVVTRRSRS